MRISKNIIIPLFVLPLLLLCIACSGSGSPSNSDAEKAIKEALKEDVPSQLSGSFIPSRGAVSVKEIKIIEIGDVQGEGSQQYWSVKVFASGRCKLGNKQEKSFKGETVYILFKDGFGGWKAKQGK